VTAEQAGEALSFEVAIVGGGPAGLTAGLYAARAGRSTVLLEQTAPGGQAMTTWRVDNYPGLPRVNGAELMLRMVEQTREHDLPILTRQVTAWIPGVLHRLVTPDGDLQARALILATGAKPRRLHIPGEDTYHGRGVSYCATCDGAFFRDMPVAVIGGGNTALEEAEFLTRFASKIYLVHRREQFRADHVIQQQVLRHPKIEVLTPYVPREIRGDSAVQSLRLEPRGGGACRELPVRGVFIFVGLTPQTEFVRGLLDTDPDGYILTQPNFAASQPGVFAAGDCRANVLKQIVVAAGEGAAAAMMADRYLSEFSARG